MKQLDPLPGAFTSTAYDVLDPKKIAETAAYVVTLEELTTSISQLQREIKNMKDVAPPSNADIVNALVAAIGEPSESSDESRVDQLRPIVEKFASSFRHRGYPRASLQSGATPALRSLYLTAVTEQVRKDFEKLKRKDDSVEFGKRLQDAENRLKKLEQKRAQHSATCLACFKDSRLPPEYRGGTRPSMLKRFQLFADATDIDIAVCILKEFVKDWRAVASVTNVPCSVHGTAISSMNAERKAVWQKAYTAMGLKPGDAKKTKVFAARTETQKAVVA